MTQIATQPGRKFIGRKAAPCRRCGRSDHWVNSLGGIVCQACEPPSDAGLRLTIVGGVWIDADNGFDATVTHPPLASHTAQQAATATPQPATQTAPTAPASAPAVSNEAATESQVRLAANQAIHVLAAIAAEEYEIVRRLHAFDPPAEAAAWGWYDPGEMRRCVDFVADWNALEHKGRTFVKDAIFFSVDHVPQFNQEMTDA